MSTKLVKNSKVTWKWLGRPVHGTVEDIFTEKVTRKIKGSTITRNGSDDNPAYLVRSEAGNEALKLGTELTGSPKKSGSQKKAKSKPKIFS